MSRELTWYWPDENKVKQLIPLSRLPSQKDPSWIDFDILKDWMRKCDEKHKHSSKAIHNLNVKRPRWLIDVRRRCLVSGDDFHMDYAALSYVWGHAECFKTLRSNLTSLQQGGAFDASKADVVLPRTIRHAIHVASILGINRLWVDALCIVQDDDIEKAIQLHGMGAIYDGAMVTFVAAVGRDANAGIPGIYGVSEPRDDRTRRKVDLVKDSEWYKRGWTFQELAFSHRRMIFTPNDVIWECSYTMWREFWGQPEYTGGRFPPLSSRWLTTWQKKGTNVLLQYGEMVEGFTKRKLTYSEDILDAFTGILVAFSRRFHSRFICGLPLTFIDSALLWQPSLTGARFSRRVQKESGTVIGPYLPSWTWAGWDGEIEYDMLKYGCYRGVYERHNGVKGSKCRRFRTCIFRYGHKDKTKAIGKWDTNFSHKSKYRATPESTTTTQCLNTASEMPKVLDLSPILRFRTSRRFFRVDNFDPAVEGHPRMLRICDDEGLTCGQFYRSASEHFNAGEEKFEFISISKTSNHCRSRQSKGITVQNWMTEEHGYLYYVLLVERIDGISYRKALGWVTDRVWERGTPDMVTVLLG